jgi:hypothetical protein
MMKIVATVVLLAALLSVGACSSMRGTIGNQEVCMNEHFLGVFSISEMVSPCNKDK